MQSRRTAQAHGRQNQTLTAGGNRVLAPPRAQQQVVRALLLLPSAATSHDACIRGRLAQATAAHAVQSSLHTKGSVVDAGLWLARVCTKQAGATTASNHARAWGQASRRAVPGDPSKLCVGKVACLLRLADRILSCHRPRALARLGVERECAALRGGQARAFSRRRAGVGVSAKAGNAGGMCPLLCCQAVLLL